MGEFVAILSALGPATAVLLIALLLTAAAHWVARRSQQGTSGLLYQLFNWALLSAALLIMIVLLPISEETRGQIISLLGVVLTAVIALASTTFVSNAMAGVMLQVTQPFRPGDYLRVKDEFGRVTKRSLVHTQIQTEWRDITTLPNLLLVNNPITVLHRDGTIISAEVSIGYDVAYTTVQDLLLVAGEEAGLSEPFVLVQELLDHAVVYRIGGFLPEMKHPLSARSKLRKKILEQLHGHEIEIVSPAFMNQRVLDPGTRTMPRRPVLHDHTRAGTDDSPAPEEKIFDKAEQAASLEELRQKQDATRQEIKREKAHMKSLPAESREQAERQIAQLEQRAERLTEIIARESGDQGEN